MKIDQFTAANEAAIEQFSYFAKLSLANVEKFAGLGLEAARETVALATQHAQAVAGARDVQEVIAINSAALEPAFKRAYAYSRVAFETAAQTGSEVKRVMEQRNAEVQKAAVAALEEAFKYAPAGSETVVANVKSAIAASQSAYDNLVAVNKQIYDTFEKTVEQGVATAEAGNRNTTKRGNKRSK
ncbi:MAG TPA: phasin family protein [Usitatibacter sp.]|nr:phasin family protein [Usitatibacter sp.]